jgi:hypothetical protein
MVTNIKNILLSSCLFSLLLCLVGCSSDKGYDEDYQSPDFLPNLGAPEITAVYDGSDTQFTTPISSGLPGQSIIIVGKNLNNLKSLKFNTVEADLSKTYTASTKAYVSIPTAFALEHQNQIEYTTDKGTTTYAFVVNFPELVVNRLDNEFAAPGDVVKVLGENFDYYGFEEKGSGSTVSINGQSLPIEYVSAVGVGVRVPEGTEDNSTVTVDWINSSGEQQSVSLPLRNTEGRLFTELTKQMLIKTDRAVSIEDDSQVTSCNSKLGTNHLHISGKLSAWSWLELAISQELPNLNISDVGDYCLAFEVLNAEDKKLLGSGYEFAWNSDWDNACKWNPGDGFTTDGKWQTVYIPLASFAPNGISSSDNEITLSFGFQPSENYKADFRLGNFRIQKK